MTQDQEIREAVARLEIFKDENYYRIFHRDKCPDDLVERAKQNIKTIETLLDLANRYLSCSSMMPSKKEVGEIRYGGCNPDEDRGYNEAIEACQLSLMKKCEGLEEKLFWHIDNMLMNIPEEKRIDCAGYISKGLSSAIQQYLTKGE